MVDPQGYPGCAAQAGFTDPAMQEYIQRMVREAVDAKAQSYGGENLRAKYEEAMDCLEQSSHQETSYQKQIRELAEQNRALQEQLRQIAQAVAPATSTGQTPIQGLVAPSPQPSQPGGSLPPGFPHYPGAVNPPPGYPAWSQYPSVPAQAPPKPFVSFYDKALSSVPEARSRSPMGQFQSPDPPHVPSPLVVGPSTTYFRNIVSMGSGQPSVIPKPADVVARAQRAREASVSTAAGVRRGGYSGGSTSGDYSSPLGRREQSGSTSGDFTSPLLRPKKASGLPNLPGAQYANTALLAVLPVGIDPLPTELQPFELDLTDPSVIPVIQLLLPSQTALRELQVAYRRWINLPTVQQALAQIGSKLRITDEIRDYVIQFYHHILGDFQNASTATNAAFALMYCIHASGERISAYSTEKFLHVRRQADQTWTRILGIISGVKFSDAQRQQYNLERRAAKQRDAAAAVNAGVATPADQLVSADPSSTSAPPTGVAQAAPVGTFVGVVVGAPNPPVVPQGPPVNLGTAVTGVVTSGAPTDHQQPSVDDDMDGTVDSTESLGKLNIDEDRPTS